ncbi:response regulator transcription factor [uncultured Alcanivorax sp.]|uniref:response regulator transcription factor n=1 Tax=uncultured Alcanivorax sp. TaxID=191215 RepID=UPI0026369995|nr:response regulator transcription factor [uncultured Alcanivorax sp.]
MEKTVRIAYLEDDMAQAELVTHWLKEAGHNCIHLASGREFMSLLRRDTFDILVLDWEVPDMNGYAVLEEVRASGNRTPVLFATQRDDESSIVGALSQGADDYMVKPTKQAELLARIAALGRRAGVSDMDDETALTVGPWTVDRSRRQILLADEPTGNLDSERSIEIMELLTDLNRNSGITVLMVTHEPDMAAFARTIVHFKDGLVERVDAGAGA